MKCKRRSAGIVENSSNPTGVTSGIRDTARSPAAGRRARPRVSAAGSRNPRIVTTSVGRPMSSGCGRGARPIRGIGIARAASPVLRYNKTPLRKSLKHKRNRPLCRIVRYEVFAAQPLVLLGLIANLTGSALQEDIAEHSRRATVRARHSRGDPPPGRRTPCSSNECYAPRGSVSPRRSSAGSISGWCASDISSVVMRTRWPCISFSSPSLTAKASAITPTPLSSGVCRWTP